MYSYGENGKMVTSFQFTMDTITVELDAIILSLRLHVELLMGNKVERIGYTTIAITIKHNCS